MVLVFRISRGKVVLLPGQHFSRYSSYGPRFTLWCRSLEENDLEQHGTDVLPPSDVLLVSLQFIFVLGIQNEFQFANTGLPNLPAQSRMVPRGLSSN